MSLLQKELKKFRDKVGIRRAEAYQDEDRMKAETGINRFLDTTFPAAVNLWSVLIMIKIFLTEIPNPHILQCWFDPLWLPKMLAKVGLGGQIDVVEYREEEIAYAGLKYPGQKYNLKLVDPIKEELPIPDESVDAILVHTILQHLDREELELLFRKFRRVAKDGSVMLTIFKCLPDGDLREYLDSIGQDKAIIHDAAIGDVSIWEKKLGVFKRIHLWDKKSVLRIAEKTSWDLKVNPAVPAEILYISGEKKLPHCAYFLHAVSSVSN